MAQWVACHAWRLWDRVLNTAPWLAQAIAIVTFALVLCQPVLLTPLLATAVAVHLLSFFSLRSFLSPHRIAQRRPVEPTSALDMTVQQQLVMLLRNLQDRHALSYVFISHDIALIASMSHRIMVMKDGRVVESGNTEDILTDPAQPYTRALIGAASRKAV